MKVLLLFSCLISLVFGQCAFNTPAVTGATFTFTNMTLVTRCFNAVPINPTFKTQTLMQLNHLVDLYSFTDIATNSGPPYNLQVDLKGTLNTISRTTYTSDWQFQYQISSLFAGLGDAHTLYIPPAPYQLFILVRPFFLKSTIDASGNQIVTVDGITTVQGLDFAQISKNAVPISQLNSFIDKRIISISGVPILDYITKIGSKRSVSKDSSVHFNMGIDGFTNSAMWEIDFNNYVDDVYVIEGVANPVKIAPVVFVRRLLNGVNALSNLIPNQGRKRSDIKMKWDPLKERKKVEQELDIQSGSTLQQKSKRDSVTLTTISTSLEGTATCQRMQRTSDGKVAHLLKLKSFAPEDDATNVNSWITSFITTIERCMSNAKTNSISDIIVDVRGNGGGIICASFGALLALIEEWNPNNNNLLEAEYDLRKSTLMTSFTRTQAFQLGDHRNITTDQTFLNLNWYTNGVTVQRGNVAASSYSQRFFFPDCGNYADMGVVTQNYAYTNMAVLTDGLCGSACSLFLSKLRYSGKASVIGVGGLDGKPMESSSFTGGNVEDWEPFVQGFSGVSSLPTTAATRFNMRELYMANDANPREFVRLNADNRIKIWPSSDADEQEVLVQAMGMIKTPVAPITENLPIEENSSFHITASSFLLFIMLFVL